MREYDKASYNIGDGPDDVKFRDLNALYAWGCTVICLQEASDRRELIKRWLERHPGWSVHQPLLPGAGAVPILYDKDFWKPRRLRTIVAVLRRFVGAGAGPSFAKTKQVNVLVLERRHTGRIRRIINTHFIASATRPAGKFFRRRDHYRIHARVLARVIGRPGTRKNKRAAVFADFNAERDFPLLDPVRRTGLRGWTTERGTHGHRKIDHVLEADPGDRNVIELSSDHRAVLAA